MTFEEIKNRLIRLEEISNKMELDGLNKEFIKEIIAEAHHGQAKYPSCYFVFELLVQWETETSQTKRDNLVILMRKHLNCLDRTVALVGPPYRVAFNEADFGLDTPDFISAKP